MGRLEIGQLEVINQYADLVGFRIGQLSTDFTETVPREGFEGEWERAKAAMAVLADLYKRVEADQFRPEPEDKEKLYGIIANVLASNITVHINKVGSDRQIVTLHSVPDGDTQHGIQVEMKGTGPVRTIINHSFF